MYKLVIFICAVALAGLIYAGSVVNPPQVPTTAAATTPALTNVLATGNTATGYAISNLTSIGTMLSGTNHDVGFCLVNGTQALYYVTFSNTTAYTNTLLGR